MSTETEQQELRQLGIDYYGIHAREWKSREGESVEYQIWKEGKGSRVTDINGKTYIDGFSGLMFKNIGYGRTEMADAVHEQMLKITSLPSGGEGIGVTDVQLKLAEKLAEITPGSLKRTFFTSGGTESVETAVKIAKAYQRAIGQTNRYKVISRRGTYHGYSYYTMALMRSAMTAMYDPIEVGVRQVSNVKCYRCDFNLKYPECNLECARELERVIQLEGPQSIAAIVFDAVSHSNICTPPKPEYWPMIRSICDKHGILIIDDEVVCGFGRTGKWFGLENWDVLPDIMATAKGISSGYQPLGAVIVKDEIGEVFTSGFMSLITFGGLPAPCAAGLKNIEIIERENLVENTAIVGAYLLEQLKALMERHVCIGDVRGIGLITQTELVMDRETKEALSNELTAELKKGLNENGLNTRVRSGMISLFPPLIFTKADVDETVGILEKTITELEKGGKLPS